MLTWRKHEAFIKGENIHLKMGAVDEVKQEKEYYELDTGSPHYVSFTENLKGINVKKEGAAIRNLESYRAEGINVNFVSIESSGISLRTFERGVEDETLSCGTGVVAAALCYAVEAKLPNGQHSINVQSRGGLLEVTFLKKDMNFTELWLIGPAVFVYEGEVELAELNS